MQGGCGSTSFCRDDGMLGEVLEPAESWCDPTIMGVISGVSSIGKGERHGDGCGRVLGRE